LGPGVYEVTVINNGDYVVNKVKYLEDEKWNIIMYLVIAVEK
jgi:hypothetical protein